MDTRIPATRSTFKPIRSGEHHPPLFHRGREALRHLLDAFCYSQQLERNAWDFAVEIASLRQHGLTNGDLRWLVCHDLVEHGRELTKTGDESRTFQHTMGLHFSKKTCMVLTDSGAAYVKEYLNGPEKNGTVRPIRGVDSTVVPETVGLLTPTWDRDLQELRLGTKIVKRFKVPAPNQEVVLAVFQEDNWPVYIDDPLPPHPEIDPRRRLHDTINSLNRNQKNNLIHFRGNGSGNGVRWELVESRDATD